MSAGFAAHNEDSFDIDPDRSVYVVADGMGGHRHGEVASRIAVEAVSRWMSSEEDLAKLDQSLPAHVGTLKAAIESAQAAVQEAVEEDAALVGMGTTIVAMIFHGESAGVAHVGDSRAYRLRDGAFEATDQGPHLGGGTGRGGDCCPRNKPRSIPCATS